MKRENDSSAPREALFNWYPGHMAKALREIKQKLKFVDVVLEIRDARVPLATGNKDLDETIGQKQKLIIFNKANLADSVGLEKWKAYFEAKGEPHLFLNCFDKNSLSKAVSVARRMVEANRKECNPDHVESKTKLKIMIIGLPNTGKSTIINQLANSQATKVANKPGQTVLQQWISIEKDVDLLDTPGIMPSRIERPEHALWLSAIHAIPDDISGEQDTATFITKHFLHHKVPDFFERYKLGTTVSDLDEVFLRIATIRGCLRQKGLPDLDRVYKLILADFRKGELGRTTFGTPPKINLK